MVALTSIAFASSEGHKQASDDVVKEQRHMLTKNTDGAGFGPQSPRDIDAVAGSNPRGFEAAPTHTATNLCNIHFHENTEHKGRVRPWVPA